MFYGPFKIIVKIVINGSARGRQISSLGRLCGYMTAILDLLETKFLAGMRVTDGGYLAPHRMDPSNEWAGGRRPPNSKKSTRDLCFFREKKRHFENGKR